MESCEFKRRFPDLTEDQVCDLAQLGKSISSFSNSLVLSLLFISKEMLISESDIAEKPVIACPISWTWPDVLSSTGIVRLDPYSGSLYNETHENINQRLASHFFPDLVLSQIAIPAAITAPTKKT